MIKSLSRKPGFALAALAVAVATAAPTVSAQEELEEVIVTGSVSYTHLTLPTILLV